MTIEIRAVVVSDTEPSGNVSSDSSMANWLWYQPPPVNKWNVFKDNSWQEIPSPLYEIPDDLKLKSLLVDGDVQFNRLIKVGDYEGATAEIEVNKIKTMVFKNGILIKYG